MPVLCFYSAPGARGVPQAYVSALLRELAKNDSRPDTLYFGGGTPALLSPAPGRKLDYGGESFAGGGDNAGGQPDVVMQESWQASARQG